MKTILQFAIALVLILSAFGLKAQDGSEYLLWEKTPDYSLFSFAISSDETKIVVTGSYNNDESYVLKAYDILTGNEIFSKPLITRPTSIARFTSDNKYLLIYNEKSIDFYDPNTYNIVKTFTKGGISFSADNKIFSKTEADYIFRIYNSDTFEPIFEGSIKKPVGDEIGSYEAFFTPNDKYLITNITTYIEGHYSERKTFQEIYDAKTFQKIDKTINCLKGYGPFSNNGLCVKTFPKEGSESSQPIGFRIYDYDKDSLIWEQETKNYSGLIFLNTKNYLISRFDNYEGGNPDMRLFKTWDLINKIPGKNIQCIPSSSQKLSKSDKYFIRSNGPKLWLFDFEKMFEANVSVTDQTKATTNIQIISNSENNNIAVNFLENTNEQTNITLYNLSGNLVDVIYSGIPSGKIEYSTAHLAKGVYLVKVESQNETFTKKIIINY